MPEPLFLENLGVDEIQKLNFDGGYVAHYRDFDKGRDVVFRSHTDTFPLYYCHVGDTLFFSNQFYPLVSKFKSLTWNPDAIADYFEGSWNNIVKYDRTPFKEIRRLEVWRYMTLDPESAALPAVATWKKLDTTTKYTEHNLEDFKRAFFECVDYYLTKIHDRGEPLLFSTSAGLDSNTLAARYAQLYPDDDALFYTSKIDDVTDESPIARTMETVVHQPVLLVDMRTDYYDFLELLRTYIEANVPPRYSNLPNDGVLYDELNRRGFSGRVFVNGMGGDDLFGAFDGEYLQYMKELLARGEIRKAYRVYKAILISFGGFDPSRHSEFAAFSRFLMRIAKSKAGQLKRRLIDGRRRENRNDLLRISLPLPQSSKIRDYRSMMDYVMQHGEIRDACVLFRDKGLKVLFPYAGYQFYALSAACDPFIFSDGVNKSCQRYAVADLLPKEVLNNTTKMGNPGMTLGKVIEAGDNRAKIVEYLKGRESRIVATGRLRERFQAGQYGQREFLALCLAIFEERVERMGVVV